MQHPMESQDTFVQVLEAIRVLGRFPQRNAAGDDEKKLWHRFSNAKRRNLTLLQDIRNFDRYPSTKPADDEEKSC